jgi:hypothetical protein
MHTSMVGFHSLKSEAIHGSALAVNLSVFRDDPALNVVSRPQNVTH